MKQTILVLAAMLLAMLLAIIACGAPIEGGPRSPDGKAAVVADLPVSERKHNIGSPYPNGPGCCVFRSNEYSGRFQNLPSLHDLPEKMVKAGIAGGGDPEKLVQVLKRLAPDTVDLCLQHTEGDPEWIKAALKTGRPVAITYAGHDLHYGMNTTIAHMVWCVYLDERVGAIVDNNFPDKVMWMTAAELIERWKGETADGRKYLIRDRFGRGFPVGGGWAVAFVAPPAPPVPRVR